MTAGKTKVLFVNGFPDDNTTRAVLLGGTIRHVLLGSSNVYQALAHDSDLNSKSMILFGDGPDVPFPDQPPDVFFNEISDADANGLALARAEQLFERFRGIPVINPPAMIRRTARDRLALLLKDNQAGIVIPPTIRCPCRSPMHVADQVKLHGMTYPVLIRLAGMHGGKSLVRIDDEHDLDQLHVFPFDGRDFFLTEFVDFQSSDGLYRKFRIIVVGGKPFVRHSLISEQWLANASSAGPLMRQRPELMEEEFRFIATFDKEIAPAIRPMVSAIVDVLRLEYFGVDCHLRQDGQLLLFEANPNVNALMAGHPRPQSPKLDVGSIIRAISTELKQVILHSAG